MTCYYFLAQSYYRFLIVLSSSLLTKSFNRLNFSETSFCIFLLFWSNILSIYFAVSSFDMSFSSAWLGRELPPCVYRCLWYLIWSCPTTLRYFQYFWTNGLCAIQRLHTLHKFLPYLLSILRPWVFGEVDRVKILLFFVAWLSFLLFPLYLRFLLYL